MTKDGPPLRCSPIDSEQLRMLDCANGMGLGADLMTGGISGGCAGVGLSTGVIGDIICLVDATSADTNEHRPVRMRWKLAWDWTQT